VKTTLARMLPKDEQKDQKKLPFAMKRMAFAIMATKLSSPIQAGVLKMPFVAVLITPPAMLMLEVAGRSLEA
jgi:hypothetical protein